jgi:hypothetical protein
MDYVFNRASVDPRAASRDQARNALVNMAKGLSTLEAGLADQFNDNLPRLRCFQDLMTVQVSSESNACYTVFDAALDIQKDDVEVFQYLVTLQSMVPADSGVPDELEVAVIDFTADCPVADFEHCFDAARDALVDFAVAAILPGVLTSLGIDKLWDADVLALQHKGAAYHVDHVANVDHANICVRRRRENLFETLTSRNFGELAQRAFPNLSFGVDVPDQIRKFSANVLPLAFSRLRDLDTRVSDWKRSEMLPERLPMITPESKGTMDRYGNNRVFRNAQGAKATFECHMWIDKGHRIHLIKHDGERQIEVGYIGHHLPTVSEPT